MRVDIPSAPEIRVLRTQEKALLLPFYFDE
jgi:hypothetical protein